MAGEMSPLKVLVSGAAGQIGYSLIPLLASGQTFGEQQPLILHLLDIEPAKSALEGVVMEIEDCAYPLVHDVKAFTSYPEAFDGINVAILVGGFPRRKGMLRKDLLEKNNPIFVAAGEALEKYASKDVKVLVVANPANTNCLVASLNAPSIPKKNFSALTRLDMNRARGLLAKQIGTTAEKVKNVVIFGNHSSTQVPDASNASVDTGKGLDSVPKLINDDSWLHDTFMKTVQQRGAAVIAARGLSSAMSAANAVKDHLKSWFQGTDEDDFVSMAVASDGSYGIQSGIIYSFPVRCKDGDWKVVEGLQLPELIKEKMKISEQELLQEKGDLGL